MRAQRNEPRLAAELVRTDDAHAARVPGNQHRLLYARRRSVPPGVLAHRADDTTGTMLFLHNLDDQDATVDLGSLADIAESPAEMLADRDYGDIDLANLAVGGYGYRWIRLCWELSP